ncbi:ribosomal large subunit pseudouridine synthase D [Vibrio ishigakensis]|uniref:Ribosomal large subunit pseudouridine synthase D n=1 Tax=Vibrio ishigakensis TaxID=1481914 RepID=A0A0B8QHR0_9VIBR|nr:ribosomal large subunit pseudouridine synthase D [Vibrio ishigakensis]
MFDILDQQPDFIVINKHPQVSVHKDEQESSLLMEIQKLLGCGQLYLVHRLDKMTSGILLLATSQSAASELSQAFADRNVEKFYLALSDKKPKKKQGLIKGDMTKSRRSAWKLLPTNENPAMTQFFSQACEGKRVFLCKPKTGKTHQIRVALKSIGSPILGDPIYNPTSNADRGYLHAYGLAFEYQGEKYQYRCSPVGMGEHWNEEQLTVWKQPEALNWPRV